jgi:hypothetical protein
MGVLVAELTRRERVPLADAALLTALASRTPVLLLIDNPRLAHFAHTDLGMCSVLFQPFQDLDRVLRAITELSDQTHSLASTVDQC